MFPLDLAFFFLVSLLSVLLFDAQIFHQESFDLAAADVSGSPEETTQWRRED